MCEFCASQVDFGIEAVISHAAEQKRALDVSFPDEKGRFQQQHRFWAGRTVSTLPNNEVPVSSVAEPACPAQNRGYVSVYCVTDLVEFGRLKFAALKHDVQHKFSIQRKFTEN